MQSQARSIVSVPALTSAQALNLKTASKMPLAKPQVGEPPVGGQPAGDRAVSVPALMSAQALNLRGETGA